jgi:hypothetical protein
MEETMMSTGNLFQKKEEDETDWEPVVSDRRKKKILPKSETIQPEEVEEVDLADLRNREVPTFRISELIRENVCIHCMGVGKCREGSKDHSGIYFPDEIRDFILNPRKIVSLDLFLKKNVPKNDLFKSYTISYTICLFNHCRKHCKHCRAGRSGSVKDEDGTELFYCYPELTRVQRNRNLILGLHIDLELKMGKVVEALWKSDHYPTLSEEEELISTNLVRKDETPLMISTTEWLDIAKKAASPDAVFSPVSKTVSQISTPVEEERKFVSRPNRQRFDTVPFPIFDEMKQMMENQREMIEKLMEKTFMMEQSMISLNVKLSEMQKENREVREEFEYNQTYRDIRSLLKEGNQLITEKIIKTHQYKYLVLGENF